MSHQKQNVAMGQDVTPKTKCCNGTRCHRIGKLEHKKHKGKMSQYGKEAARNRLEICHRWTKCHKPGKRGWTWCHKWHDVHLGTGVDIKSLDVVNECRSLTGTKCHSGLYVQWTFRLGRNVQWMFRWWTFCPGTLTKPASKENTHSASRPMVLPTPPGPVLGPSPHSEGGGWVGDPGLDSRGPNAQVGLAKL
jgi:hypothetical protein